jgi:prepilin-type N-terminal cleavage/methylation domain-containing protein
LTAARSVIKQANINNRGFTLIELVMVIVIGCVAMFPLLSMFANATANSVQPELATKAVFLAQERIETVLADYRYVGRGYNYIIAANYPAEASIPGFPGFSAAVSVSAEGLYDGVTYREVTVTVSNPAIPAVSLTTWVTR